MYICNKMTMWSHQRRAEVSNAREETKNETLWDKAEATRSKPLKYSNTTSKMSNGILAYRDQRQERVAQTQRKRSCVSVLPGCHGNGETETWWRAAGLPQEAGRRRRMRKRRRMRRRRRARVPVRVFLGPILAKHTECVSGSAVGNFIKVVLFHVVFTSKQETR